MRLPVKALLASSLLFAVPLLTVSFVEEHERQLLRVHETAAESTAATIATALSRNAEIASALSTEPHSSRPLFAARLDQWIDVDGRADHYGANVVPVQLSVDDALEVNAPFDETSLKIQLRTATEGANLFLHADINDDRVVYRELGNLSVHRNDHLQFAFVDPEGGFRRYTVAPTQPGAADVFRIASYRQGSRALRPDEEIEAYWRATEQGYAVEVRIPLSIMSAAFSVSVSDVDDADTRRLFYTLGTASTTFNEDVGYIILPDPLLDAQLREFAEGVGALSLLNSSNQRLAEVGEISEEGLWKHVETPTIPLPFYRSVGSPVMAIAPLLFDDRQAGSLALAQSSAGRVRAINGLIETVCVISLMFIVSAMALLFGVTGWIAARISGLRERLAGSVDPQGRVKDSLPPAHAIDELGELQETFRHLTDRLQQYNRYLEEVSRRLSHELRTPITVVSSSLDNLSMQSGNSEDVYIERARDGVSRLSRILSSMSEATRLESSLNPEDVEYFDIANVVEGSVQGYETAYKDQAFELSVEAEFDKILGLPDLVSQLMDKLVSNAAEFATPGTPIRIRLTREEDDAVLRIMNEGPSLPASGDHLFDSMISIREAETADGTHLGLGLYIARLIAEFHGGDIDIADRADTSGVIVTTRIPLMRIKGHRP